MMTGCARASCVGYVLTLETVNMKPCFRDWEIILDKDGFRLMETGDRPAVVRSQVGHDAAAHDPGD